MSVSDAKVVVVAAGPARLGTGTQSAGNGMFVRVPITPDPIVALATQTVLLAVIAAADEATLKNAKT